MDINLTWSCQTGFEHLSDGGKALAIWAEKNEGSISGALKENPALIDSVDEFTKWSTDTIVSITTNNVTTSSEHSIKKLLRT